MDLDEEDAALGRLLRGFAKILAKELAVALRGVNDEWIPQQGSPLGNRRHCSAVRRRAQRGDLGAVVDGKRFLLSRAALQEEMMGLGKVAAEAKAAPATKAGTTGASTYREELLEKVRAVRSTQTADAGGSGVRERLLRKLGRL